MNFWYPSFLIFGVLVAVPIVIHLFNFRKFRKVYYSNVALVKASILQSKKQREVIKWLLLLVRMGLIACLVMAFAKPIWGDQTTRASSLCLVVDNSSAVNFGVKQEEDFLEALKVTAAESLNETRFFAATNTTVFQKKISSAQFIEALNTKKSLLKLSNKLGDIADLTETPKTLISPFSRRYELDAPWIKSNEVQLVLTPTPLQKMIKVDSVYWSQSSTQDNQILAVKTSATGAFEAGQVKLYLNRNLVSTIPIDGASDFEFDLGKQKGRGELKFYDQNGLFLSSFFFVAQEINKFKVLEVGSSSTSIKQALNPDRFDYDKTSLSNFDFDLIRQVDVAFVHMKKGQQKAAQLIADAFLKEGKTVCVLVNEAVNMQRYGVKVEKLKEIDSSVLRFPKHQLFTGVFEQTNRKNPVFLPKVMTTLKLSTINKPVLQTQNKNGVLVQSVLNPNCFVALSELFEVGEFTKHALFVPTLYQMVFASQANERLYFRVYDYVKVLKADRHVLQDGEQQLELPEVKTGTQPYVLLPKELRAGLYQLDSVPMAINTKVNLKDYQFYNEKELRVLADSLANVTLTPFDTFNKTLKTYKQVALSQGEWRVILLLVLALLVVEMSVIRYSSSKKG